MATLLINNKEFVYDSFLYYRYLADGTELKSSGKLKEALLSGAKVDKVDRKTGEASSYNYTTCMWECKEPGHDLVAFKNKHGSILQNSFYANGKRLYSYRELHNAIENKATITRQNRQDRNKPKADTYNYTTQQWEVLDK